MVSFNTQSEGIKQLSKRNVRLNFKCFYRLEYGVCAADDVLSMFHEALGVWKAWGHLRKQVEERGGGFHLSAAISCVWGRLNEVNRLLCVFQCETSAHRRCVCQMRNNNCYVKSYNCCNLWCALGAQMWVCVVHMPPKIKGLVWILSGAVWGQTGVLAWKLSDVRLWMRKAANHNLAIYRAGS